MSCFRVQEHSLPTSHIREYPRATAGDQDEVLHLAIKQYTPLDTFGAKNEVTIIGAHANGFPKELYEPFWDDLYQQLKARSIRVRSIWIADVAHQGASGVLNETRLGNDPSWMDHPRDLFLMVNHFREHMKRPLIGIGHSMGGNNLINLSLMHPRLFTSLILLDPVIVRFPSKTGNFGPARLSTKRRDRWPSRRDAEAAFRRSKFYQAWDPRVLDKWVKYGLRDLPTQIYPSSISAAGSSAHMISDQSRVVMPPASDSETEVTLTTTKHQEVFSFLRPNFATESHPFPSMEPDPLSHPDADPASGPITPFYRPEPSATFYRLPFVRPSVFYVFGEQSYLSEPVLRADKLAQTGIGVGGSGGFKKDRVGHVTLKGVGHLIPMESVREAAEACASWISPEIDRWRVMEDAERLEWAATPRELRNIMSEKHVNIMNSDWEEMEKEEKARLAKL